MNIHCSRDELLRGVQAVQPAISQRATLPILGNILIESNGEALRLSTTDLEMGIRQYVPADIVAPGATTIPAKTLLEFLRTLEEGKELEINSDESHKTVIKAGRDRCILIGLPKEDFPVLPEFEEKKSFTVPANILSEITKKTIFSISTDETRYVLQGINFMVVNKGITAVSTDGRRLAYIRRDCESISTEYSTIIPGKTMHEVMRLAAGHQTEEPIAVSFSGNQIAFRSKNTLVISRIIEGHFPNYEQVIPKSSEITVEVPSQNLLLVTQRAAVGTQERGGFVRFSFAKGELKVYGSSQGRVEVEAEIEVKYNGPQFDVAFNPDYIIDMLKVIDAEAVILEMAGPLSPCLLRPASDENYKYVVMPMKT